jgi:diamine N-acetyltransferase
VFKLSNSSKKKSSIKYLSGDQSLLDKVSTLWEGLNEHQGERSTYFKHHFAQMTFQKRKADLLRKAKNGKMHVVIAVDESTNQPVGYLVSSVNSEKTVSWSHFLFLTPIVA